MHAKKGIACQECSLKDACAFRGLSDRGMEEIESHKITRAYSRGETIFHQGDESSYFYCVSSGSVQIFRNSPYREQSFTIAKEGDWLGFRDALTGEDYQHNARVLKAATVCRVPREKLQEILVHEPGFAREVSMELATGWRAAEMQSYNLGARNIMERLADFLLGLRQKSAQASAARAEANSEYPEADLPLTREVIATLLGSSTESIIRALSDFKARGWIDTKKGKVVFRDEPALERILVES
jgi:CRP/FNR family transcriptional regulator